MASPFQKTRHDENNQSNSRPPFRRLPVHSMIFIRRGCDLSLEQGLIPAPTFSGALARGGRDGCRQAVALTATRRGPRATGGTVGSSQRVSAVAAPDTRRCYLQ